MEKEIWKVWYESNLPKSNKQYVLWEVSNLGRIKRNGELYKPKDTDWYYCFGCGYKLHRVVAELFIPNPENKRDVDHINGDKHDNRAINLRWVTHRENMNNPHTKERQIIAQNSPDVNIKKSNSIKTFFKNNPEARKIRSESKKGVKNPMYGKNLKDLMTEEAYNEMRRKQRESNIGKHYHTEEAKEKNRQAHLGKHKVWDNKELNIYHYEK